MVQYRHEARGYSSGHRRFRTHAARGKVGAGSHLRQWRAGREMRADRPGGAAGSLRLPGDTVRRVSGRGGCPLGEGPLNQPAGEMVRHLAGLDAQEHTPMVMTEMVRQTVITPQLATAASMLVKLAH